MWYNFSVIFSSVTFLLFLDYGGFGNQTSSKNMNNILVVALTNSLTHLKFDYFQIRRIWLEAIFPSLTRPRQLLFASGFFANLEDL